MRRGIYLLLSVVLVVVSLIPVGQAASAQGPGTSPITPVVMPIPANWAVYEDVNKAWWLRYPPAWAILESIPGRVTFQSDALNNVEIVVEPETFPLPYDNWLTLDLVAQGAQQSLSSKGQDMKMVEVGRWFRGVFGLFFTFQGIDLQVGAVIPSTVVMTVFGQNQSARASFSAFSPEDKDTIGIVLSSLTAGAATVGGTLPQPQQPETPPPVQVPQQTQQQGGLSMAGTNFGPIVFAENLNAQNQPVNPRTAFPSGITAVYAVFDYNGMQTGTEYTATWYMNGAMVFTDAHQWDLPAAGAGASVLLSNSNGFPDGAYKLELSIGGQVVQQGTFTVGGTVAQPEPITMPTPGLITMPTPQTGPVQIVIPPPQATPIEIVIATPEPPPASTTAVVAPPAPKPAGRATKGKIVYTQFDGDVPSLWIINVDGSGDTRIKGADHASDPSWSPDGSSIVFVGWDGNPRGGSGIYTMNPDGSNVKLIWNQGSASYLDWALPGRYVALTSIVAGTDNRRIIIYDGKDGQWFDIGPGEQASFSPDANRLVAKSCIGGDCGLYVMNRDGSNKWRLTTGGDDAMAAWSPIGDRIAYASQRDGNWDIWMVNTDGSGNTRLTQDPGIDAMPAWLPDGSGIAFRSSRGGSWGVWVMNPDGSNPTRVVDSFAGNDWGRARLDVR